MFMLWVALPTAAVYCAVCGLVLLVLHSMSSEMNAIDAERSRASIGAALESLVVKVGDNVADESTWTEAYLQSSVQFNPAWLDSTWGVTARISESYDTALVTDAEGQILFGEASRGRLQGVLSEHVSAASELLTQLDAAVTKSGDDVTVQGFAGGPSGVMAIAGGVIHSNSGQEAVPRAQRRILWLAKHIDDKELRETAARFKLPRPRFVPEATQEDDTLVLTDAAGAAIGVLAWEPRRPGAPAFAHTASIAALVMVVLGLLTFVVLLAFHRTIKGRAAADQRDWQQARFDAVTGLVNQFGLEEMLRRDMPRKPEAGVLAVATVNFDDFWKITGSYGRETGDRLLDALADAIELGTGGTAMLGRTGPAEFTLALVGPNAIEAMREHARTALTIANSDVWVGDLRLKVGASIGLAHLPAQAEAIDKVLRMAETAMVRARETGGNHMVVYDASLEVERDRRLELQADIRRGLDAGEFDLAYQPIFDFTLQQMIGVEALMRWDRRAGGPMTPAEFIPEAEASGLIEELGMFALRRAVMDVAPLGDLKISVNVSAAQFRNPLLAHEIDAVLEESKLPPERLQLEITETFLVAQPARAKHIIQSLRSHGIVVALDDFGTGFSSIGYLRQFRFDRVKLDRSLVAYIDRDPMLAALVESTMVYAYAMGLKVTAEGVERREEAALLSKLGCREFQGFLLARPMSITQLQHLLATDRRRVG